MDSTRSNVNGALSYSTRTTAVPEEGDSLTEFLKTRSKEGFAASAYWGATGELPPREPDDVTGKNPYRFKEEINRKLVPFPKDVTSFPKTVDYSLTGFHLLKDGSRAVEVGPGMNEHQMRQLLGATGESGLPVKSRFLTLQTTLQRMPGAFDDDVLKTLRDGQAHEDDHARQIGEVRGAPLSSGPPDPYRPTSDDYCDVAEIDPSSWRVQQTDKGNPDSQLGVYRSRYNNVEREGPKKRERTHQMLEREHEVDPAALRETLDDSRRDTLSTGYKPWSAKEWMSTTHREHANYDTTAAATMNNRNATVPLRNANYQLSPEHEATVLSHNSRMRSRNAGEWATEYSDGYQDRLASADLEKRHGHRNVFDVVSGVYTIDHKYHHPRDDTSRGETYTPSQLVPGQYVPMSKESLFAPNQLETST